MSLFDNLAIAGPSDADDDFAPDGPDPSPMEGSDGDLWCETGGHPFVHTGRGRKPKNCPEHRKAPRANVSGGTRGTSTRKLTELEDATAAMLAKGGLGFAAGKMPVMGTVMVTDAPKTAHAIVELCKNNPKALKALETATKVLPVTDVAEYLAKVVVGAQVDLKVMAPDHWVVGMMGVDEIYLKIYGEMPQRPTRASVVATPPPPFVRIN